MEIQWLGHSAFKAQLGSAQLLFDPFLNGNPKFSGDFAATIEGTTHVLMTHAHNDHFGDTIEILRRTGATLVANYEIASYVTSQFAEAKICPMNIGGTASTGGVEVTLTRAHHSSSYAAPDGRIIYGGEPGGVIARVGGHSIYHMGDTNAFSDMALIDELHRPEIGIVPIGDWFTMGAREAHLAVNRFFHFKVAIPCHYATFPMLAQNPDAFVRGVTGCEVWAPKPMDEREF
jgi:L-ascorbate metabolism protein UlaG (beta-lactamase superfamily)